MQNLHRPHACGTCILAGAQSFCWLVAICMGVAVQVRTLRKKLQQIDALVQRAADSSELWLDPQQQAKVATRGALQAALDASESGASVQACIFAGMLVACALLQALAALTVMMSGGQVGR